MKKCRLPRLLERLSYAVFGLGDRRYREFNYAAAWWKLSWSCQVAPHIHAQHFKASY